MKTLKFLIAVAYNTIVGLVIASLLHFNPAISTIAINLIGIAMAGTKKRLPGQSLFVDLATEVWLPDVMDFFYPDSSFLVEARDLSSMVDNDAINLAEAGIDPTVLFNNSAYPIAMSDASDTPLRLVLNTYDTTSTVVRNAVALELAYDQRSLYTKKHQRALLKKFGIDAAYAFAPIQDNANNPVIDASADAANVILDRIIELQTEYNTLDAPLDNRILVLDPTHAAVIAKEDKLLYKSFEAAPGKMLFGFKTYMFSKNPIYVKATGVKAANGAAFVNGTHLRSSFAFIGDEVMKAQGTFKFFNKLNDPDNKGDVFNYQMRGLVSSMRSKYSAAILK